jgi:hypothetical protein
LFVKPNCNIMEWDPGHSGNVGHNWEVAAVSQLDLEVFLAADFEGRIRLTNQAHGVRLWSHQLALIWAEVLDDLAAKGKRDSPAGRRLMSELIALAPDSEAAERAYHAWIGDNDRSTAPAPPAIVYLIVSCHKEQYKAKAIAHYRQLSVHLKPIFILVGDQSAADAVFDAPFLTVPAPDNYEGLTRKVLEGLVAVRRKFGRVAVLKIDDDTQLITPPRRDQIAELIATTQYAGAIAGDINFDRCWHVGKRERLGDEPYRRRFRGDWTAGPLYYLGPEAVELLVREYLFYPGEFDGEVFGFEDKAIGDVLRARGLQPTRRDLLPIFGIAGPFDGAFGDQPPALAPLKIA